VTKEAREASQDPRKEQKRLERPPRTLEGENKRLERPPRTIKVDKRG